MAFSSTSAGHLVYTLYNEISLLELIFAIGILLAVIHFVLATARRNEIKAMHKWRHDIINHIIVIRAMIDDDRSDEALEYLDKMVKFPRNIVMMGKTDHHEINGLLHTKVHQADAKQISIDVTVSGSFRRIPLNPIEIGSILGNLIDNAMDAVTDLPVEERHIYVELTNNADKYVIRVTNENGGAISEDILKKVFNPKFSTKGHQGLGLIIVKELTERHGGCVTVKNVNSQTVFASIIPA